MKTIFLTVIALVVCTYVSEAQIDQKTSLKQPLPIESATVIVSKACKKAASEKKKVLLLFRASWNPWTDVLETAMMRPEAKAILNKYYVVSKITVEEKGEAIKLENPGAAELFANYYANTDTTPPIKKNVPCLIFLNVGKNKIAQYTGFPEGKEGFNNFENCLKQTSGISQNEIGVLRKVFMDIYVRVTPPAASEILNAAFAQATAENKKVFLVFHASWCHWCHVLDTAMNDPACKSFFTKNYIICHLTVSEAYNLMLNENPGAAKLISNYQDQAGLGKFQRGIPLSVVFDKDGNKLGIFNGFPTPFYAGYKDFENLIKNTASVSEKDLETIKEVFDRIGRKNGLKPKK